jgi:ribose/xylose/arabinose/galactoside ABC-type transport system permease subunit
VINYTQNVEQKKDPRNLIILRKIQMYLLPVLIFFVSILFSLKSKAFLSVNNLDNIAVNSIDLALVAAGLTLVILMGSIDVSTGYAVGLTSWFAGTLVLHHINGYIALLLAILIGSAIGSLNGFLTIFFSIPSIVATLGMAAVYQTLLFILWGSQDLFSKPILPWLSGSEKFISVPVLVLIVLIIYVILHILLTRTFFGRSIFAIGSNIEAARLIGLNIKFVKFVVSGILGVLIGIAACTYLGRVGVVQVDSGNEITLMAIAAVVVGGTSILGGEGSVLRTLGGVAFIGILNNGIVLSGVPSLWNGAVLGAIILFVVLLNGLVVLLEKRGKN